jgi:uncharacterized protein YjiS (DUF1127 family)
MTTSTSCASPLVHTGTACGPDPGPPSPVARLARAFQRVGAYLRAAGMRYRHLRRAKATYDALRDLDDRTLRDLGFERSELASVVAEMSGTASPTRVRIERRYREFQR